MTINIEAELLNAITCDCGEVQSLPSTARAASFL